MEGEQEEDQNYLSFGNFSAISQALEDDNMNVSKSKSLALPPLPQRLTKKQCSRSNQNQNTNGGTRDSSNNLIDKSSSSSTTMVEDQVAGRFLEVLRNGNLAQTTSAPSVLLNENSKKRNRSINSSNESSTSKPVTKKSGTIENTKSNPFRVSFVSQVNQNSDNDDDGTAVSTATSTSNARAVARDSQDVGTGPSDQAERIKINPLAKPMWEVTRLHLINQQKAHLRAEHLKELLLADIMPIEFFGAEPLHRYYATNDGILSEDMQALIGRQAREKAELAQKELSAQAERESRNATYFGTITAQIYQHEGDDGFDSANVGLQKVVAFYQKSETSRLALLKTKETERQPKTELEWTNLVCQPINQLARSDRSSSRGRKRQRNGSSGRRGPKPKVTIAPQTAPPSNSYKPAPVANSNTTQQRPTVSKNYKGNNPNPNHNNRPQQQSGGQRQGNRNSSYQSHQQPQNQQFNRPKTSTNQQRRPEPSHSHQSDINRPGTSRQPQRSSSTERMMAAIVALKEAMKD